MTSIDKTKPALVTGATGYVAGVLIKKLLDEGITVHAAVRDPENKKKLQYLDKIAAVSKGSIIYFKSDLLLEGSYEKAMEGCEVVFHTASPFTTTVKDPRRDLVDPALKGTRNVLNSVNRTDSVKRVVLTSSCAAIIGDVRDFKKLPDGKATEEHWNTTSSLSHQPYSYSKVIAEKEAWNMNKKQDRWDLVVINPSLVIGPGINPDGTSESFNIIRQLGDGTMKAGAPDFSIGAVDVRDVAEAHFRAAYLPQAKGRHVTSAENISLLELAKILNDEFGDKFQFPKRTLPKFLVWLFAPASGLTRKFISTNVGFEWNTDNSKSIQELGINYIPIKKSVTEFFGQMVNAGLVKKK